MYEGANPSSKRDALREEIKLPMPVRGNVQALRKAARLCDTDLCKFPAPTSPIID